jgi:ATP-dependent Lon protease
MKEMHTPAAGGQVRPNRRVADRDLALQVSLLKQAIGRYGSELAEYLPQGDDADVEPLSPGQYRLFNDAAMANRLAGAKEGAERLLESEISKARDVGAVRCQPTAPSLAALDELSRDYPHCEPVIDLLRQRTALAQVTPGRAFSLPPVLLIGDGGVGKTAFAEAVARTLALPTRRLDMGSATAGFLLAGSHSSWSAAKPGAVWTVLKASESSAVMLIDEIDKSADSRYPPCGPLYTLLEPSSARTFVDEYVEVEIDASHVIWIATCNDPTHVEPALRSRFREFVIEAPTSSQMRAVARSVYRQRRTHAAWGAVFPEQLDDSAADAMSACTPCELAALVEAAAAHAATCCRTYIVAADVAAARKAQLRQNRKGRRAGFV